MGICGSSDSSPASLFEAAKTGNIQSVREFLKESDASARINRKYPAAGGASAIHAAAGAPQNAAAIIELLVGVDASVRKGDNAGNTALHYAARNASANGPEAIAKVLEIGKKQRLDVNENNNAGETAADLALALGGEEHVNYRAVTGSFNPAQQKAAHDNRAKNADDDSEQVPQQNQQNNQAEDAERRIANMRKQAEENHAKKTDEEKKADFDAIMDEHAKEEKAEKKRLELLANTFLAQRKEVVKIGKRSAHTLTEIEAGWILFYRSLYPNLSDIEDNVPIQGKVHDAAGFSENARAKTMYDLGAVCGVLHREHPELKADREIRLSFDNDTATWGKTRSFV